MRNIYHFQLTNFQWTFYLERSKYFPHLFKQIPWLLLVCQKRMGQLKITAVLGIYQCITMHTKYMHIQVSFSVATMRAEGAWEWFGPCMDHLMLLKILSTVAPREHFATHITDKRRGSPFLQYNNMHLSLGNPPFLSCASKTTDNQTIPIIHTYTS